MAIVATARATRRGYRGYESRLSQHGPNLTQANLAGILMNDGRPRDDRNGRVPAL